MIKLESHAGDDTRHWAPPSAPQVLDGGSPEAVYFMCTNRNKKSVGVDFKTKEGQELIRELAKKSDVVVENYIPGTLAKYGLSYKDLSEINPRIIYVSLTGEDPTLLLTTANEHGNITADDIVPFFLAVVRIWPRRTLCNPSWVRSHRRR